MVKNMWYSICGDIMTIGIICEYNPFHYGHLLHLKKIKEMYKDANIILAMSGWITQRGDLSLIDKFSKTEIALEYGVDLVVEIPFKFIQSADYFAKGAIKILNLLGCDKIVFGSESNNADDLKEMAQIQLNNSEYNNIIKNSINSKENYPTILSNALFSLTGKTINTPNDLLGLCYTREIIENNYNIDIVTIKRKNNYNSLKLEGKITSATSIREQLKKKKSIKKYVPHIVEKKLKNVIFLEDYFDFLKYKIITSDITDIQGIDTNLSNRIKKYITNSNNLEELINSVKSKKYTYNRIKRSLTFILLSITKDNFNNLELEYLRILGFNNNGKELLNKVKKSITIPLITNYDKKYLSKDLNITTILSLNKKIKDKKVFIEKEYKQKPIIK